MKRMKMFKQLICMLLLAAIVLSLTGCSMERRGEPRPTGTADETRGTKQTQTEPVQEQSKTNLGDRGNKASWQVETDPTIREHMEGLRELKAEKITRKAANLDLYVENTEAMVGFVPSIGATEYTQSVRALFDAVTDAYSTTAHYLVGGSSQLYWVSGPMDDAFRRDAQSLSFYQDNNFPSDSPLGSLFQGASPFEENNLTIIVTGFKEPGFDLTPLSRGIEKYFKSFPDSAACIVAFQSDFNGADMAIPYNGVTDETPAFYVRGYVGTAPCYIVMVGPEADVQAFLANYERHLATIGVTYSKSLYANNVYDQIVEAPLEFEVVADQKAGKLAQPVLSSYNTGVLSQTESRTVFSATYEGIEARDESSGRGGSEEKTVEIRTSTQIAALSTNYVPGAEYTFEHCLYAYDQDAEAWVEASKNAQEMVQFTHEIMDGEVVERIEGKDVVILAAGRQAVYLRALLDFSKESVLSRDTVYRLEVRVKLNHPNYEARSASNPAMAEQFGISSSEYYRVMNSLCPLLGLDKQWRNSEAELAASALPYTPNLSTLLTSLDLLESSFRPEEEYVEYLDFIFNLGDGNRR